MMNSTQTSYLTFSAYFHSAQLKYLYFVIVLLLYVFIVFSNLLLVVIICLNRSLHEPMYMFLCSLFVNELYGSTGMFLLLMVQILSESHTISTSCCFLQMLNTHSYGGVQFWTLTIMSYDRYLAICFPLQYSTRMSTNRVFFLIAVSWFVPFVYNVGMVSLVASLQLCGNIVHKVYCDYHSIVKLACYDTTVIIIYELIFAITMISLHVSLILYSYTRILKVSFSGSRQTRQKAASTCTPHLIALINVCFGVLLEGVQSRFHVYSVPKMLRMFLSLYFVTCQPLLFPVMYGLKLHRIRIKCKTLIFA